MPLGRATIPARREVNLRISICIPAYNRADYLPELLDSIVTQKGYGCELEVVISDNASTDNTSHIIERYRNKLDRLVYHCWPENMGADRNFLKVVEIASGDFCWLMGSDDKLEPGAVAVVEQTIGRYPDIAGISVRRNLYGANMDEIPYPKMEDLNRPFEHVQLMTDAEDMFRRLGDYVGYLSGTVLSRKLWNWVISEYPTDKFFNAWVHVYIIGQMIRGNPRWVYVPVGCVGWRMNNDFFLGDGMYRRLEIDVVGYSDVTAALFGKESEIHRFMMARMMLHARHRILHARAAGVRDGFTVKARTLIASYYRPYPMLRAKMLPALYLPQPLLAAASKARRFLRNVRLA